MSGERILVIDDSREIVRHLAEQVLPTFGYRTLFAYDGRTGLQMIRQDKPDLIMLDLNLPEMTGLDILEKMVQESITIPVILMTGYGTEKSAVEAFRLGVKDYLVKPFTVDEVVETINRALIEPRLRQDKQQLADQLRRTQVEMRRRMNEMSALFGIGKAVASLLSVDKVLERVLDAAVYLSGAEESAIWLLDKKSGQLRAFARQQEDNGEPPLQLGAPGKDTYISQVMRTGRALRKSQFAGKGVKIHEDYWARSILCVPLTLRGQAMGVLSVYNCVGPKVFSERDEYLLSALADYAAIALENARVFQATDQALTSGLGEMQTLIRITRTLTSSLELDKVVRMTIQQVHDSWQIEASSIWLLDEEEGTLRLLANVGTSTEVLSQFEIPVGRGFVGHVAQTADWIYTNQAEEHPIHYKEVDKKTGFKTRSLLCVPLIFCQRVIGVLQLLNKLDGDFDDQDVERALTIATAVAIGISNALLYKEVESRQQQLEAALEHNSNPIIVTDQKHRLVLLNHQARVRMGLSKLMIGQPVGEVLQPAELAEFVQREFANTKTLRTEVNLPDETTWIATLARIPDYGRILFLQDITYLKDIDQAKSNFVSIVSHDLRAPLNSIIAFALALHQSGSFEDEQKLFISRIVRSAQRMLNMVNGLLDLARISSGMGEHILCDIKTTVREVMADLAGEAMSKKIRLELSSGDGQYLVYGEPTQLRQAIGNLVDNAIKYSPNGHKVEVDLKQDEQWVYVEVRDTGVGIQTSDLPRIFDEFYRIQNANDAFGSGLGLSVVRSVAEAHGGRVWVESERGMGSVFFLELPAAHKQLARHEEEKVG